MRAPFLEHASGDQNRKSAFVSGAVVETVCTLCHISLSAYHRASPNVGWSRFRAVLMLTAIVPAAAIGWNGTKVWNVINRGARGFPKRTRWVRLRNSQAKTDPGYGPEVPPFARRGTGHLQFFPLPCGNSQAWFGQVGIPRSSLRSLTADETATDAISDGGCRRAAPKNPSGVHRDRAGFECTRVS